MDKRQSAAAGKAVCDLLALHIAEAGLPAPEREYLFAGEIHRRWRFDFAWPDRRLALEVSGGRYAFAGGRHASDGDYEKLCWAAILGWRVMAISQSMVNSMMAIALLQAALEEG